MRTFLIPLAVVVALTAVACSGDSDESAPTTAKEAVTTTTASGSDGGKVITDSGPITLATGADATIELEANPTTGYQWELSTEPDTSIVRVVSDEYTATTAEDGMVGVGGTQRVVLQGVAAGTTTIEMRYVRPWETDQSGADTATFDVTVS